MSSIFNIFPIKILVSNDNNFEEYKNDITSWLINYSKNNQSVKLSNQGGYQSSSNFYLNDEFKTIYFNRINDLIMKLTEEYIEGSRVKNTSLSNMWFNINHKGTGNCAHIHSGSSISGVFWIKVEKNHPPLLFYDPLGYQSENMGLNSFESFYPSEGDIILFPSHILHMVDINHKETDRISLSFNINVHL